MYSDWAKLVFLGACLIACLATLFTSPSIVMGNGNMKVLNAQVGKYCSVPRLAKQRCTRAAGAATAEGEVPKEDCSGLEEEKLKCAAAVKRAYQHINMAGCPMEIKSFTLCDAEWCKGTGRGKNDPDACERECNKVWESLNACVDRHVFSYFHQSGLEKDGTTAKQ